MRLSKLTYVFAAGLLSGMLIMPIVNGLGGASGTAMAGQTKAVGAVGCLGDIVPPGGDGSVDVFDLLAVLENWGACPIVDSDSDGVPDSSDNCPFVQNADQSDADSDGVGDVCDNCPFTSNSDQLNSDADQLGDACDNCPFVDNPGQENIDGDAYGAACDCDDTDENVNPGATEVCNGIDDNCDSMIDEGCACPPGTADCNGLPGDGCEVNTQFDPANCAACGVVCPIDHVCNNGNCVLACPPGFSDCNGNPFDGCETNTATDPQNCGGCNLDCPPGMMCVNGSCVSSP